MNYDDELVELLRLQRFSYRQQQATRVYRRLPLIARHVRDTKYYGRQLNALGARFLYLVYRPLEMDAEVLVLCCVAVVRAHDIEGRRVPRDVVIAARRSLSWLLELRFGRLWWMELARLHQP